MDNVTAVCVPGLFDTAQREILRLLRTGVGARRTGDWTA
jgi:hypothetical protein